MKKYLNYMLLGLLVLAGCNGCKEKVDPCANQKPTTANFKVWERSSGTRREQFLEWYPQWKDIDSDTIAIAAFVAEAEEPENPKDSVAYRWEVGSEILTTRKVSRSIFSGPLPPYIDLKLTVTKRPNKACNPSDPGIATFSRRIYIAKEFKWVGVWHGYINNNPADTLTVYIIPGTETTEPAPCRPWLSIGNFPIRGWFTIFSGGVSYEQFGRTSGGSCVVPSPDYIWVPGGKLYGIVDRTTGKLHMEALYSRVDQITKVTLETKSITFTGSKIR
jgi:hypothetical protein